MMTSTPPKGYAAIADTLRRQIAEGEWPAGCRLPRKLDLCQQFGVSDVTIQRALNVLSADGFLEARGRAGTFVREQLPCGTNIGVVIPNYHGCNNWYNTIEAEVRRWQRHGQPCVLYWVDADGNTRNEQGTTLSDDLRRAQLAGLLVAGESNDADAGSIPCQHLGGPHETASSTVLGDTYDKVLTHLATRGCQRLALWQSYRQHQPFDELKARLRPFGMSTHRYLVHSFANGWEPAVRSAAELMMRLPKRQRPDCLYIADDHLVTQATLGLQDAGGAADILTVAHANFPTPPRAHTPVTLIGHDIPKCCRQALASLKAQIAGETVPLATVVEPVCEDEVENVE